jgi:tRNA-(MS[2]IO[6]A)-hydroxylase MiaE-like protein
VPEVTRIGDPDYRAAVLDLLGLLAYAELAAFFRMTEDALLAPTLADKAELAKLAVAEFGHFRLLMDHLAGLGADPERAMAPFVAAVDAFHAQTVPSDWQEGLVKACVGNGIAADFYRAIAEFLDPGPRDLVLKVMADTGRTEFAATRVRAAIQADPAVAGRLALWARRLVGEALGQAQRVAAEHELLARLLAGHAGPGGAGARDAGARDAGAGGSELGDIGRMFAQITDAHARRMATLGLDA